MRRKKFTFINDDNGNVITIKAWSEARAWKRIRQDAERSCSGHFGLTYDALAYERKLSKVRLQSTDTGDRK
jgi:hypothetical protein